MEKLEKIRKFEEKRSLEEPWFDNAAQPYDV